MIGLHDIRISILPFIVAAMACSKPDDGTTGETSGDASSTAVSTTTGDVPTTGSGEPSSGSTATAGTTDESSASGTSDEESVCRALAEHFVDCFPREGVTVEMVEMLCEEDSNDPELSQACIAALKAYNLCLSTAPCETYDDSCLAEANERINACAG